MGNFVLKAKNQWKKMVAKAGQYLQWKVRCQLIKDRLFFMIIHIYTSDHFRQVQLQ